MKLWLKLSFGAFAASMIVGSLYATGRIGTYRVGRDIKELGLHPSQEDKYQLYDPGPITDLPPSNYDNYYGTIMLSPRTDVGIAIFLEVEANRIVSVSRRFYED